MSTKETNPKQPPLDELQSGGVAVAEKPKEFEDDDRVTVLHGWGRVTPGEKHFVDKILFKDGIARDVPYAFAKHWQKGTRPDGKQDQVYGKVNVHILPSNATEADFCRVTGITPMPIETFATQLAGVDLEALVAQMGVEKVKALIDGMEKLLPPAQRRV